MATSMTGYSGITKPQMGKVAGYNAQQVANYTPQQMQLMAQMLGQVGPESQTYKLAMGDESVYRPMEERAMQQFGGIQGQIASRFSGLGTGGRHSSGFQNTMTQAGSDFAAQIAQQRSDLQRQAIMDLHSMSQQLLSNRPYETFLSQPDDRPSFWQQLVGGAMPVIGAGVGALAGGLPGATLGAQIGGAAGQSFLR